jgi:hypothetical protein
MAVAMLAEIPGLTQEQYETVVTKVNETGSPAGALFHAGGPIEDGYLNRPGSDGGSQF